MSISLRIGAISAIPDYATLQTTLQSVFMDRDDLAALMPTFILLAEADMNRELRTPQMETTTTISAVDEDTALPTDFQAMRSIYVEGSPDRPLNAKSPTALRREYNGQTGTPNAYALVAGKIRLAPPPAAATALTIDYFATLENLSPVAPSNWVLEQHPSLYIWGPLFYAYSALDNKADAQSAKFLFDQLINRINTQANQDRWGGGPLTPNTVTQVRRAVC